MKMLLLSAALLVSNGAIAHEDVVVIKIYLEKPQKVWPYREHKYTRAHKNRIGNETVWETLERLEKD